MGSSDTGDSEVMRPKLNNRRTTCPPKNYGPLSQLLTNYGQRWGVPPQPSEICTAIYYNKREGEQQHITNHCRGEYIQWTEKSVLLNFIFLLVSISYWQHL